MSAKSFADKLQRDAGELDHPCKQTCSGWKQGFDKGHQRFLNESETRWKTHSERLESLLAQEKAAHEETKRSLAEVMSGCGDCHAFKSAIRERDALKEDLADAREEIERHKSFNRKLRDTLAKYARQGDK